MKLPLQKIKRMPHPSPPPNPTPTSQSHWLLLSIQKYHNISCCGCPISTDTFYCPSSTDTFCNTVRQWGIFQNFAKGSQDIFLTLCQFPTASGYFTCTARSTCNDFIPTLFQFPTASGYFTFMARCTWIQHVFHSCLRSQTLWVVSCQMCTVLKSMGGARAEPGPCAVYSAGQLLSGCRPLRWHLAFICLSSVQLLHPWSSPWQKNKQTNKKE